tara:strand:- start:1465 stop:2166 length:702 start_codon:yes stop_codon:yes gene_type:complete
MDPQDEEKSQVTLVQDPQTRREPLVPQTEPEIQGASDAYVSTPRASGSDVKKLNTSSVQPGPEYRTEMDEQLIPTGVPIRGVRTPGMTGEALKMRKRARARARKTQGVPKGAQPKRGRSKRDRTKRGRSKGDRMEGEHAKETAELAGADLAGTNWDARTQRMIAKMESVPRPLDSTPRSSEEKSRLRARKAAVLLSVRDDRGGGKRKAKKGKTRRRKANKTKCVCRSSRTRRS